MGASGQTERAGVLRARPWAGASGQTERVGVPRGEAVRGVRRGDTRAAAGWARATVVT